MKLASKILSLLTIIMLSSVLLSTRIYAMEETHLVFDTHTTEGLVTKKFRINQDLRASASGQFSADELPKMLQAIPAERRNIWIVDLRQESHGFIDGLPVSWVGERNSVNVNKSGAQISREEKKLLRTVKNKKTVIIHMLKKLSGGRLTTETPTAMIPEQIETEEELVTSLHANYARIYVLDHFKPDDKEVDNFVQFIKQKVGKDDWLHFHCRGGKGRSSTFIALYDMIKNAHNTSFDTIMRRQADSGNKKLDEIPSTADKAWKIEGSQERIEFMHKFYAYVTDPQGYQQQSWSAWQKTQV